MEQILLFCSSLPGEEARREVCCVVSEKHQREEGSREGQERGGAVGGGEGGSLDSIREPPQKGCLWKGLWVSRGSCG